MMNAILALVLLLTPFICGTLTHGRLNCTRDFKPEDLKHTESPYINRYWHCEEDASADIFPSVGDRRETWLAFDTASESSEYHGYTRRVLQQRAHEECYALDVEAGHAIPIHNMDRAGTGTGTDADTDTDTDSNDDSAKRIAGSLRGDALDFSSHMRKLCAVAGFRHPFADYCKESKSMCAIPQTAECLDFFFSSPSLHKDPCAHLFDSVQVRDEFFEWRRAERNATKFAWSGLCFFDQFFICRAHPTTHLSSSSSSSSSTNAAVPSVLLPYTLGGLYLYEFAPTFGDLSSDPNTNANANVIAFQFNTINANANANANRRLLNGLSELAVGITAANPIGIGTDITQLTEGCRLFLSQDTLKDAWSAFTSGSVSVPIIYMLDGHSADAFLLQSVSGGGTTQEKDWNASLSATDAYHLEFAVLSGDLYVEAEQQLLTFAYTGLGTAFRITAWCARGDQPVLSTASVEHVLDPTGHPASDPTGAPNTGQPSATPTGHPSSHPSSAPSGSPSRAPSGAPSSAPSGAPSSTPSGSPSSAPTGHPVAPTRDPTATPTSDPIATPTSAPSATPVAPPVPGWELYSPATAATGVAFTAGPPSLAYFDGNALGAGFDFPYFQWSPSYYYTATGNPTNNVQGEAFNMVGPGNCFLQFDNTDNAAVLSAWTQGGITQRDALTTAVKYQLQLNTTHAEWSVVSPAPQPVGPTISLNNDNTLGTDWNAATSTMTIVFFDDPNFVSTAHVLQGLVVPFQMLVGCAGEMTLTKY